MLVNLGSAGALIVVALLFVGVVVLVTFANEGAAQPKIDVEVMLVRVVDGDTVRVTIKVVYNEKYQYLAGSEVRVRLADINAPEIDTEAGIIAMNELKKILSKASKLYMDIDDIYVTDRYGRLVAVLYAEIDGKLLNVNAYLVENGYAKIWDHYNEFNPSEWKVTYDLQELHTSEAIDKTNGEDLLTLLAIMGLMIIIVAVVFKALTRR